MFFWYFMVIVSLLIPGTMIGFGRYFMESAPKNINSTFGYRTKRSMMNMDTWQFAHAYVGKLWFRWGVGLLVLSVSAMLLVLGKDMDTVGIWGLGVVLVQMLPLVGSIFPTERALKRTFDEYGRRK